MADNLGTVQLWVVGRTIGETWEFCGVFDTKEQADNLCRDETYFVGPVQLNMVLPTETQTWPGSYRFEVISYE